MPYNKFTDLSRFRRAFSRARAGLRKLLREETAFQQEVLACLILIPVACLLDVTLAERLLLVGSLVLVLIVEILNSALEATVDLVSLSPHDLAKKAKDAGAAAVMLALILAIAVWITILLG